MTKYICSNCGSVTEKTPLNFLGEGIWSILKVILFLIGFIILLCIPVFGWILAIILLFIPISKKQNYRCEKCQSENCLIPVSSPKGKELYKKYNEDN